MTEYVDFSAVREAANRSVDLIVERYLPGGKWEGNEYTVLNPTRADSKPGSFKINRKGVWKDFATGDKGDMISLVAYVKKVSPWDAARDLASLLGVPGAKGSTSPTGNIRKPAKKAATYVAASPAEAATAPAKFPDWTKPDADNKPRFVEAGDRGPHELRSEKRRHTYCQGGVPVKIKIMRNGEEAPLNVYRVVSESGATGWQFKKPIGFKAVPYFLSGSDPFNTGGPIYWPEGEKDADTVGACGLPAFTFGGVGDGLPAGCEEYVRDRDVVILADNDDAGRKHAEAKANIAIKTAKTVRVVHFPELPKKHDVSDWLPQHSIAELLERVEGTELWPTKTAAPEATMPGDEPAAGAKSADATPPGGSPAGEQPTDEQSPGGDQTADEPPAGEKSSAKQFKLPRGYSFYYDGLYWGEDSRKFKLAGCFDILAETRDSESSGWGVLIEWVDRDGHPHRLALPKSAFAGDGSEARRMLLDGGLYVSPGVKARQLFNAFLLQVSSPNRARAVHRIGWNGNTFVLPDASYGAANGDTPIFQPTGSYEHSFRQSGSLKSWQDEIARYAINNSRLAVALSAALVGPLIAPMNAEGGGIHFRGGSSTGKTTALRVAGSVWGGGDTNGFTKSWRATSNGLESIASVHNDTLLCLDELSQLPAREAGETAYMLSNGSGKSRASREGLARRSARWRILFISSGELGLADKIAEEGRGRKATAGQQVRIVDIPADAGKGLGIFEDLHGFPSAKALADHLRAATQKHYGVASREYLKVLVASTEEILAGVAAGAKAFCDQYVPAGSDGQVERVAQRFALIAMAGETATEMGILPWPPGTAMAAAGRCFEDWLSARGGTGPAEEQEVFDRLSEFIQAHGMSRFVPAWEEERNNTGFEATRKTSATVRDVAGYRKKSDIGEGWDYFITSTGWKEIYAGLDQRRAAAVLKQRGGLVIDDKEHNTRSIRIPGEGNRRVYHIPPAFLDADHDA